MDMVIVGIDLGKNSCSVVGMDAAGWVVLRRRLWRGTLESFVGELGLCIVAMEACCGAHHLGRIFAARGHEVRLMSLGLVPRQMTTGGKSRLLGISKRGNRYWRKNLIHGARAALPYLVERDTPLGRWARGLLERAQKNVVVVALAAKLARIAWAVLARGCDYDARFEAAVVAA